MKHFKEYITEVSAELASRAAKAQRDKLNDDSYIANISGLAYKKLLKRAQEFQDYANKNKVSLAKKYRIPADVIAVLTYCIKKGYYSDAVTHKKYGVSEQNIFNLIDYDDLNLTHETFERLLADIKKEKDIEFKYKTDKEWKDAGLEDPS